jgi:hypothetical protein
MEEGDARGLKDGPAIGDCVEPGVVCAVLTAFPLPQATSRAITAIADSCREVRHIVSNVKRRSGQVRYQIGSAVTNRK